MRSIRCDVERGGAKTVGSEAADRTCAGVLHLAVVALVGVATGQREAWKNFDKFGCVLTLDGDVFHLLLADNG